MIAAEKGVEGKMRKGPMLARAPPMGIPASLSRDAGSRKSATIAINVMSVLRQNRQRPSRRLPVSFYLRQPLYERCRFYFDTGNDAKRSCRFDSTSGSV